MKSQVGGCGRLSHEDMLQRSGCYNVALHEAARLPVKHPHDQTSRCEETFLVAQALIVVCGTRVRENLSAQKSRRSANKMS